MAIRNGHVEQRRAHETFAGIDTDGNGDVTLTVSELREIEHPGDVTVQAAGGYMANVQSVSGNDVTVRIYQSGGADSEGSAVTGGTGVTDVHVGAVGH